jgi:hypothetical protein
MTVRPERARTSAQLASELSTDASLLRPQIRPSTAMSRHQSDDRSRIDRSAVGRFGGGDRGAQGTDDSMPRTMCLRVRMASRLVVCDGKQVTSGCDVHDVVGDNWSHVNRVSHVDFCDWFALSRIADRDVFNSAVFRSLGL